MTEVRRGKGIFTRKRNRVITAVGITGFCYFVFCITGRLCTYTDNLTISVVTGGMYGDNNYCQYLHPFQCLVLKTLTRLLPTADTFMLGMHITLLACILILSYAVLCHFPMKPIGCWGLEEYVTAVLLLLFIFWLVWGQNLFDANYTVQTAALIFAGLLILFAAKEESRSWRWIVAGTALVAAGFLYRLAGALLFLPFIGLEVITEIVRAESAKEEIRQIFRYIVPCLLLLIVLLGAKGLFISQEPYATDMRYTSDRTTAVDYPMAAWGEEGINQEHLGIDQTTYECATSWVFLDTDVINAESLARIASAGSRPSFSFTPEGFRWALKKMMRNAMYQDIHLTILILLTLAITAWNLIAGRDCWLKAESACGLAGSFIILLYYTFRGRALLRVWQAVLFAMLFLQIIVALKALRKRKSRTEEKRGKRPVPSLLFQLFLCVVLYFGIGQVMAHSELHAPITPLTCRVEADDSMYAPTFEDDALYIWPNWYEQIPKEFSEQNKLPTQRTIEHNIAVGDWVYGQEYFREFLKRINAENPAKALLERPHTYLIEGQNDLILRFMREHYGDDIVLVKAGRVNGHQAYQMKRN